MKSSAGQPQARRPVQKKPVQLNLRRTPTWPEEDELDEPGGNFWKWFALVCLLHVVVITVLLILFHARAPKPPVDFIQVFQPTGDLAKGTPGKQSAPKIAPTTAAPSHPAATTPVPTPPKPVPVKPVKPKVRHVTPPAPTPKPPPIIKEHASEQAPPVKPPPPKRVKVAKVEPPKPRIKVDLSHLVDAPTTDHPPPKAKMHPKKPVKRTEAKPDRDADVESETSGLSREQVARELGNKLKAAGTEQGRTEGPNGSTHAKANEFADFYQAIHDQVMSKWSSPNLVDETAIDPIVQIHIEKNGRVPADQVKLLRSSNNPAFDQSALAAARGMGYTLQPLPDGCPPDISITFNLRQQ